MEPIFRYFVQKPLLSYLLTGFLLLLGFTAGSKMQRSMLPDTELGVIIITTTYPGASAEDVEQNVTDKIEKALTSITGIQELTSISQENLSQITVQLDLDAKNHEKVRKKVYDAVQQVQGFPKEVRERPQVIEPSADDSPFITVALTGEVDYAQLRQQADRIEKKLRQLPGIEKVERSGYRAREVQVELDPQQIKQRVLPVDTVLQAIESRNVRSAGGNIESYVSETNVLTMAQFRSVEEIGDVIVRSVFKGTKVRIKDLAKVNDGFEAPQTLARINGQSAISFAVYRAKGADMIGSALMVRAFVDEDNKQGNTPAGIRLMYCNDASIYVRDSFNMVSENAVQGLYQTILVLGAMLAFFTSIGVSLAIPFAMCGCLFFAKQLGYNFDVLTLMGLLLVLGMILDGSIVISDNVHKYFENGMSPEEAAIKGTANVFPAVFVACFTTVAGFFPMLTMGGVLGRLVKTIPMVVMISLAFSLIYCLVVLPGIMMRSLQFEQWIRKPVHPIGRWRQKYQGFFTQLEYWQSFEPIRQWVQGFLKGLLKGRYFVVAALGVLFFGTIIVVGSQMSFVLMPSGKVNIFSIKVDMPIGTSLKATSDAISGLEKALSELPPSELDSFITTVGGGQTGGNSATIAVGLVKASQRTRSADEIINEIRTKAGDIPNANVVIEKQGTGPNVGKPISLRIVGSNDELREKLVRDIIAFAKTIDGVTDLTTDAKPGKDSIIIKVDPVAMADVQLTAKDVARTIRTAFAGEVVTTFRSRGEEVNIRVTLSPEARGEVDFLRNLLISNPQQRLIPLRPICKEERVSTVADYRHLGGERTITVEGNVDQKKITPLEAADKIMSQFNLDKDYPGLRFDVGGEGKETTKSMTTLAVALFMAVLAIFALTWLHIDDFIETCIVCFQIPFGIVGVILALAMHGQPLSFFAVLGIISLAGVVEDAAALIVENVHEVRHDHPDWSFVDCLVRGTAERTRAIFITVSTNVVGLFPMAYTDDPLVAPMALALSWGLTIATPITFIFVPCLMAIRHDFQTKFGKKNVHAHA